MNDDPKTEFYLTNRALIEEWAGLRPAAASALDLALLRAAHEPAPTGPEGLDGTEPGDAPDPGPALQVSEDRLRHIWVDCTTDPLPHTWFGLSWEHGKLLAGAGGWPALIIGMSGTVPPKVRDAVKNATVVTRDTHGLVHLGQSWLRYGPITPVAEPIVIEEYAQYCVQRLRQARFDLDGTVRAAVKASTASAFDPS